MASLGDFTYHRVITIDTGSKTSGSLTSFPVCVVVNSAAWSDSTERGHFFAASNVNGKRIQFFASDESTNLDYEVNKYDSGAQSAIYWVRIPTLTGNGETDIVLAYGNDPNSSDQDNATGVWDANYKAVWHLGNNGWGSAPEGKDSTSNGRNLTNYGSTETDGQAGKARLFDGLNDYCNGSDTGLPTGSAARTMSCWAKPIVNHPDIRIFFDYGSPSATALWAVGIDASMQVWFSQYGSSCTGPVFSTGSWQFLAAFSTGSSVTLRRNTTNGTPGSMTINTALSVLDIGRFTATNWHNIALDEMRISDVVRTDDWLKGEYYSLLATSWPGDNWLTVGSEVSGGGGACIAAFVKSNVLMGDWQC